MKITQSPNISVEQQQNNLELSRQADEHAVKIKSTEELIQDLIARVEELEGYFDGALTDNTHFVCNNDTTYNGANSKGVTIENGIIKSIEA